MATALCPGSFDPVTNGHLDIIERTARHFSHVVVAVIRNPQKSQSLFTLEERQEMLLEVTSHLDNVRIDFFKGLLVDYAREHGANAIGKGLREWLSLGVIDKKPRLAGIQADAADPFYQSYKTGFSQRITRTAGETAASAIRIGAPVSHPKAEREIKFFDGVVGRVTEAELLAAAALANRHGLAICPNSAVALAGARKLREEGTIARDALVVVVATAHAIKFSSPATAFHASGAPGANPPRRIDGTLAAVEAALGL